MSPLQPLGLPVEMTKAIIFEGVFDYMKLISKKSVLKGSVAIPGSKSHTIRAVAIASLAKGQSLIRQPLTSSDTLSAVACYRALGAKIDTSDSQVWKVIGTGGIITSPAEPIDCGNSGTTTNIAMGSAALADEGRVITLTGDAQTCSRPVGPLAEALTKIGARCVCLKNNGKPPVSITGKLKGGRTSIAASTSQYLSSLLLCAPLAQQDTEIEVTLLNEPGYARMTLDWLDRQKIKYENQQMRKFIVKGNQSYRAFDEPIAADFSSATFFLCAAALCGEQVTLLGLDFADSQPDKAVVDYLRKMGADITVGDNSITVRASKLKGADIDMNATPDALPALAVTAAFAEGKTGLLNVPQARAKETDRIKCMAEEMRKLSVDVEELSDGLVIHGGSRGTARPSVLLDGRGDHRIVMAMSLAGFMLDGRCIIDTAEAMSVTFPNFVDLMRSIGADIQTAD
jgi:3-phosphoshikimate 1-carboxyvinyltransferase